MYILARVLAFRGAIPQSHGGVQRMLHAIADLFCVLLHATGSVGPSSVHDRIFVYRRYGRLHRYTSLFHLQGYDPATNTEF